VHPGRKTLTHCLSYTGGPVAVSIKITPGTRYAELIFLHPVELRVTSCNLVHPEHETSTQLVFMRAWDWYGFGKKRAEIRHAELEFLHPVGSAGHTVHSGASRA
jgi:hypothetical protein